MKLKNIELKEYHNNIKNDIYVRDHIIKELIDLSLPKLESSSLFISHSNIHFSLFERTFKQNNSQQQNDEFILGQLLTLKPNIALNQKLKSFQTAQNQYQEYSKNTNNFNKTFDMQFEYLSQKVTQQILYLMRTQQKAFKCINIQNLTKILVFNFDNGDTQVCVRELQLCSDKIQNQLMNIGQQLPNSISSYFDIKNKIQIIKQRKINKYEISAFLRTTLFNEKIAFSQKLKQEAILTNLKNNLFQIKLITKLSNYFICQIQIAKTINLKIHLINILIVYQDQSDSNFVAPDQQTPDQQTPDQQTSDQQTPDQQTQDQQKNCSILNQQIKLLNLNQIFICQIQFTLFLQYLKMIHSHLQTKINQTPKNICQSGRIFHIKYTTKPITNTNTTKTTITKSTATKVVTTNETATNLAVNGSNVSLFQVIFTRIYQEMFQLTFQLLVQLLYTLHSEQKIAFQFIWLQQILKQLKSFDRFNIQKCIGRALIFNSSDEDYVKNIILLIQFLESFKLQQLPLFHKKTLHFFNVNDIKNLYQYQKISENFDNYCCLYYSSQSFEDINKLDNYSTSKYQDLNIQSVFMDNKEYNQQKIRKFDQLIDLHALQKASWKNQLSQSYQDENDYQYL